MKSLSRGIVLSLVTAAFSFQSIYACSINVPPLRKVFRRSKSVFSGRVLKIEDNYQPTVSEKRQIPELWTEGSFKNLKIFSKVTFEIEHKWKGNVSGTKQFVAVAYWGCGCLGDFDKLETGKEYIVFAKRQNFITVCEATVDRLYNNNTEKKLDDFWFRTWARIFPF